MASKLVGQELNVVLQWLKSDVIFEMKAIAGSVTQSVDLLDTSVLSGGSVYLPGQESIEVNLTGSGGTWGHADFRNRVRELQAVDEWLCIHCNSPNPRARKMRTYKTIEQITHCLKCGAARPFLYG